MRTKLIILLLSVALSSDAQEFLDLAHFPEDIRISGSEPMSGIGHRVLTGDVNGDGYPDILAGGEATETYYTGGGAAFLIFGGANPRHFISTDDKTGITTFWGNGPQEYTAEEPGCFDFNGDGLADLFINAPQWNYTPESSEGRGRIYYFPGRPAWPREVFLEDYPEGKGYSTIWGQYPRSYFGFLSRHGDLNGDGIDDLIVASGRGRQDVPLPNQGTIYIIWGGQNPGSGLIEDLGLKISKIFLPRSISYPSVNIDAGDANGDGYDDLFVGVGATFDSLRANGRIFVIWGSDGFPNAIELETAFNDPMISVITSDRERSQIGTRIFVCDLNSNGIPDLLMSHYDYSKFEPPPNDSIRRATKYLHLFYDPFTSQQRVIRFFDPALKRTLLEDLRGEQRNFGSSACFTDWDGDGFQDVVIGNHFAGRNRKEVHWEGSVYILYGNQAFADTVVIYPPEMPYRMTTIYGGSQGSWLGISVTAADMNRDSLDDLVLGAWSTTTKAGASAGEVYVLLNKTGQGQILVPQTFALLQPFPNPFSSLTSFAYHLPWAGDVDVKIYNIRGQIVRNLFYVHKPAGEHWASWNGLDDQFNRLPSGLYFIAVHSHGQIVVKKIILLKDR